MLSFFAHEDDYLHASEAITQLRADDARVTKLHVYIPTLRSFDVLITALQQNTHVIDITIYFSDLLIYAYKAETDAKLVRVDALLERNRALIADTELQFPLDL